MASGSRPVRVLQILEATAGGTRRHLRELITSVSAPGIHFQIACSLRRDPTFAEDIAHFRALGVPVHVLPMTRAPHPVLDLRVILALQRLVDAERFDVLHLHSARAGWFGRLLRSTARIIYAPHAYPFLQTSKLAPAYWIAERWLARRTHTLHAVAEAEARLAIELGFATPESVRVIENAVDLGDLDHRVPRLAPIPEPGTPRTFAFVGDLRAQKAPLAFVEAARIAVSEGLHAHFLLPEHGPLLEPVRDAVRRAGLEHCVHFLPADGSLDTLYSRMHIAVLPSLWEGLPYTLLECMGLGRPVITSDLPVFADFVGRLDRRLIAPRNCARALSSAMRLWATISATELAFTGLRCRELVAKRSDFKLWLERMRNLYLEPLHAD